VSDMGVVCGVCGQNQRLMFNSDPLTAHLSHRISGGSLESRKSSLSNMKEHLPANRKILKTRTRAIEKQAIAKSCVEAKNAVVAQKPKTHWDILMISMSIKKHAILADLAEDAKEIIVAGMKFYVLGPREYVFQQGNPGVNFFVVAGGSLEVIVNSTRVNVLKPGDSFGELALMHNDPRSASIRTLDRCTLWAVDRKTFRSAVEAVNQQNYLDNRRFIDSISLFQVLTNQQKESLVAALTAQKFLPNKHIIVEGEYGDLLYIITEGTVCITVGGQEKRRLTKGDYFGEMALLYNAPRSATITAADAVKVLCIGRDQLNEVLGTSLQQIIYRNSQRIALDASAVLKSLTREQKEKIISKMEIRSYASGEVIMQVGHNLGEEVVVVLRGQIKRADGVVLADKLQCLGDQEFMEGKTAPVDVPVVAGDVVDIAHITREQFESCIGGNLAQVAMLNEILSVLKRVQLFKGLSNDKISSLVQVLRVQEYEDKAFIFQQNEAGDAFFIIKSGDVEILRDNVSIRVIHKMDFFGERAILLNEPRSASVQARGPVTCWALHRIDFNAVIDEAVRNLLIKRIQLQDDSIKLNDLKVVKQLGKGMFGFVYLVVHRTKKTVYALKSVTKAKIELYEMTENILLERRLLLLVDNNMVVKLVKTFRDEKRIFFLLELVRGQDLFDVIRTLGLMSDSDAVFYTCCVISILEHLHELNMVYRDLKPENIMIDEQGYPKLIDFGTAKVVEGRTFTIVGTPHYMAPEVILGKGYGVSADYWSLGVMVYEFVCGKVPFGEDETDPTRIYDAVVHSKLEFPGFLSSSPNTLAFLDILLNKNPAVRAGGGLERIREMKWVKDFNWEKMLSKSLKPPYVPKLPKIESDIEAAMQSAEPCTYYIEV